MRNLIRALWLQISRRSSIQKLENYFFRREPLETLHILRAAKLNTPRYKVTNVMIYAYCNVTIYYAYCNITIYAYYNSD